MDIKRPPDKNRTRRRVMYGAGGGLVLVVTTVALAKLEPAAPTVDGSVWIDSVRRGPMVINVRGPGTLVPEQIHWISAVSAARVDRILARPGDTVSSSTVLLETSNPDVQINALTAQSQLANEESRLITLRSTLETDRLNQESAVAQARSAYREALRTLQAADTLSQRGLISANDLARAKDIADETAASLKAAEGRLSVMTESASLQLESQKRQVDQLRAVSNFNQSLVRDLTIRAGASGVVQELSLEVGQWISTGTTLARVAEPGKLKAVIRVPETQASMVLIGQKADIDTRTGIVVGKVMRIEPASSGGTVAVEVRLEGELPRGARPDLSIDGTVEIERLEDVLYVGRPAFGAANSSIGLFKLVEGGNYAIRVTVRLGRHSVNTVEIQQGLEEGDKVILSDMQRWDAVERVKVNLN